MMSIGTSPRRAASLQAVALVGLTAALSGAAWGQDHLPKPTATQRQSQLNPAPMSQGNPQRRGWMGADILTGIADGNRLATQTPYARIAGPLGAIQPDYWPFPQPTRGGDFTQNGNYYNANADPNSPFEFGSVLNPSAIIDDQGPAVALGLFGSTLLANSSVAFSAGFAPFSTPSTGSQGGSYHAAPATANAANVFVWYPRVDGLPGDYRRFNLRVFLPTPATDGTEGRITDAKYLVTYHVPLATGRFILRQKTVTLSQQGGGWFGLTDGFFPMMTEATYNAATSRSGAAPTLVNANGNPGCVRLCGGTGAGRVDDDDRHGAARRRCDRR